jgi:AcrR family transcriptional regulator
MGLRARKKEAQRRRILDACSDLFRKRGFDETTVDEILERVGVSRQTFFNYFPSKQAALRELGAEWMIREGELAVRAARGSRGDRLLPRLKRVLRRQLRAIEDDRDFMRLVFTRSGLFFPQSGESGGADDEARTDRTQRAFALIAAGVAAAQARGEIRGDVDPQQVAEIYTAVFYVTTRLWLTDYWGGKERLDTRMLRAVDLLMSGLRAHPEDGR